jgi:two-component system, chemotaxis family, sensor kinase CheA
MSEMDEVISEFLVESYESLDRLDQDLLALEQTPDSAETLASIFRTMHTIKGTCGFLGFSRLEAVTHVGENLLGKLRDGELAVNPAIANALLATGDAIRTMLGAIETTGMDGEEDYEELCATLARLVEPEQAPKIGELLVSQGKTTPEAVAKAEFAQVLGDDRRIGEIMVDHGDVAPSDIADALHSQGARGVADATVRVDVMLLDELMNLVGELVLARNGIVALTAERQEADLLVASQRLNLITTELQESVMKTRMQPVGNVWGKFPRVVRDLALQCGKKVRVEMEGQDTELDKSLVEAIKDPLTHLVRNAVDHGIEAPADRLAVGKPDEGTLLLRAFHEGGQVNLEITDDGAGLDLGSVKAKAVERGLVTGEQVERLSDREAINLIFLPGFSTASEITSVSGRGVGMDVVKTNIERIGGTVDVLTTRGMGTSFRIKIPLTLAIIPALVVSSGGERYAIPQVSLLELVRLAGEHARAGIEEIQGALVHRLRGRLLPVVHLEQLLGRQADLSAREVTNIVVLQTDGRQFGLIVDEVLDTQEIVVKPLGKHLNDQGTFAGATIMGDGRVALILDVMGIAHSARISGEGTAHRQEETGVASEEVTEGQTLLLVDLGDDRRAAIPLYEIDRLEDVPIAAIERTGDGEVVQYRGQILPLIDLPGTLGIYAGRDTDRASIDVVVHRRGDQIVGLVVGKIVDIVQQQLVMRGATQRHGIVGSAVVQSRVTEVIDIAALVGGTTLVEA